MSQTPVSNITDVRACARVIEYIKSQIMLGVLKAGDRLPTERELSSQLAISRNPIREALKTLENMGIVESRQGSGSYLSGNIGKTFTESLSLLLLLGRTSRLQLSQLRRALDTEAFRLCAGRLDAAALDGLDSLVAAMERASSHTELTAADQEFHDRILAASGNSLIQQIMHSLSAVCSDFIDCVLEPASPEERKALLLSHRRILEALKDGRPEGTEAVHRHYDLIDAMLERALASQSREFTPAVRKNI